MNSPLAISLARQLSEIEAYLKAEFRPGTPEGHFALHIYEVAEEEGPLPKWGPPMPLESLRQGQGPSLAATAYQLVSRQQALLPEVLNAWEIGLRRLSDRNAFPIDRQTFAFRPIELYGITLGASRYLSPDHDLHAWIRGVLVRLQREASSDPWTHALCSHAARQLGIVWAGRSESRERVRPIEASSFIRWSTLTPHSLCDSTLGSSQDELDREILKSGLTSTSPLLDVARAAVVHHGIRRAASERLESELSKSWLVGRETADAVQLVSAICRRFHFFARQIQSRYNTRSTIAFDDEYDVQDAMHAILSLHFIDVRPEEWTPSYGGRSTRMDFLLKRERVVVEVKMTRKGLDQKGVIVQLTEDKERYRVHQDCRALVCFVYDPSGFCDNPSALEDDLSVVEGEFKVSVVVAPHGS